MKQHTKIYLSAFGYDKGDFIYCEVSFQQAVDIHHIIARSEGGEDRIENLMALTRKEHTDKGDKKQWKSWLFKVHRKFLEGHNVSYDKVFMSEQISKWEEYEKVL